MSIPSSITQILATLILVVPGFVFQSVRIRLQGRTPGDTEATTRILGAIVASTMFSLAYLLAIGPKIVNPTKLHDEVMADPRCYAVLGMIAAVALPAIVAYLASVVSQSAAWEKVRTRVLSERLTLIDPRPSAWDVAFSDRAPCFIRVRNHDKTWYAGWFGAGSYASSWPDPRTVYVEIAYEIDENGRIGTAIDGSVGAFIDCSAADYFELVAAEQDESGTMETTEVS